MLCFKEQSATFQLSFKTKLRKFIDIDTFEIMLKLETINKIHKLRQNTVTTMHNNTTTPPTFVDWKEGW